MTARSIATAWFVALSACCGLIVTLLAVPLDNPFAGYRVAVIGSSLMRHAVPPTGDILGEGQAHLRFGPSGVTEGEVLDALEQAVAARPETVLVEVNPLIRDFANERGPRECDDRVSMLRAEAGRLHARVTDAARIFLGRKRMNRAFDEQADLDREWLLDTDLVERTYPLFLRDISCRNRFSAMVSQAKAQGTSIVLVLPPRSQTSRRLLGADAADALRQQAGRLAMRHGLRLYAPAAYWPDALFQDHAHVNGRGRAAFQADLRNWWAHRP